MDGNTGCFIFMGYAGYFSGPKEVRERIYHARSATHGPPGNAKALLKGALLNAFIEGWSDYQKRHGTKLVSSWMSGVNHPANLYSLIDDCLVPFMGDPLSQLDVPNWSRFIGEAKAKGLVVSLRRQSEIESRLCHLLDASEDITREIAPAIRSWVRPFRSDDDSDDKLNGLDVGSVFCGPDTAQKAILASLAEQWKIISDRVEDSCDMCHSQGWLDYIQQHPDKNIVFAPVFGNLWSVIDGSPVCFAGEPFSELHERPPLSVIGEARSHGIPVVERGPVYRSIVKAVNRLKTETTLTAEPRLTRGVNVAWTSLKEDDPEDPKADNAAVG